MKMTFRLAVAFAAFAFATVSHAQGLPAGLGRLTNMLPLQPTVSQSAMPGPTIAAKPENTVALAGDTNYVSIYKRAKCAGYPDASAMGADKQAWQSVCNRAYQNDGSLTNLGCGGTFQTNGTDRARAYAERQAAQCKAVMDREAALEAEFGPVISKAQRVVLVKPSTPNGQPANGKGAVTRF